MDENTPTPSTTAPTSPKAPRKARKPRKVSTGPRTIDPGIAELRAQHAANVAAYKAKSASAGILDTIINKRLVQLTDADRQKLLDALQTNTTPALPIEPTA